MTRILTDTVKIEDGIVKMSGIAIPTFKINDLEGIFLKDEDYPLNISCEQQKQIDDFYLERDKEFEKLKELTKDFVTKYLVSSLIINYNVTEKNEWQYFHDSYHEKLLQNLNIT